MTYAGRPATPAHLAVRAARDHVLAHQYDYAGLRSTFAWPTVETFNFGLDWFDVIAGEHPDRVAVKIVDDDLVDRAWTYGELAERSDQVARWLLHLGMKRGDRMIVMLHNSIELWEILLGLTKMGGVALPTSTLLAPADLAWRVRTAQATYAIAPTDLAAKFADVDAPLTILGVGDDLPDGWTPFAASGDAPASFTPQTPTSPEEPCLLYFTSGTTSHPKLVEHSHVSYPIGHLSTMYWLGVRPGDVHLNISSPGWGKHAWSNFYGPFLAQATVFIYNYERFDANKLMAIMATHEVSSFCAPPTVWRMLIQADLTRLTTPPRELVGAGEALNPEVINTVRAAWNNTIRDGFGQTEMTCAISNGPGEPIRVGAMGRPSPGYDVVLVDAVSGALVEGPGEGEICLDLAAGALPLMTHYYGSPELTGEAMRDGRYHTGDIASRDVDGYLTYVGRADDVFKASDYKISPFEVESALMTHPSVAECAVVPSPDEVRGAVPKAYVQLSAAASPDDETARSLFAHAKASLNGYQLVRIVEFVEALPKTVSAKIRRVELREAEAARVASGSLDGQFFYADYRTRLPG